MRHLNYTHLLYFWNVAREGSVAKAAEVLNLTPQTISGQIKLLEETTGEPLFTRVGRGLVLTDTGQVVRQYADEIFMLGAELTQRIKSKQTLMPTTLNVGIVDSMPKLIALRVLEPALSLADPIKIVCHEGEFDRLLGELAVHRLDIVLSDRSIPSGSGVKAYSHALGETGVALFAKNTIAKQYKDQFPKSLDGAPMLLPLSSNPMRRALEDWFDKEDIQPSIVAEFDDSALLKAFGEAGHGIFPAPSAISKEVCSMYHAEYLGQAGPVTERYFAISPERKLKHPAVVALTSRAREKLFH
ncbi:MAG: LysR family transcriptional activator of nhaA [Candidatus Azotimanducaceae bacterium]|jgi:LysR family transcriptional activator of nhaA